MTPDFLSSLSNITMYDVPLTREVGEGMQMVDHSQIAAFTYGGNWYVAPKVNGQIPADPSQWSLVVDNLEHNPNTRFYHEPSLEIPMTEQHQEWVSDIGRGLKNKRDASFLPESASALSQEQMAEIIISKEAAGKGLHPAANEPLAAILAEHGTSPFTLTKEELAHYTRHNAELLEVDGAHNVQAAGERLLLKEGGSSAFMGKANGGVLGAAFADPRERVFYAFEPEAPLSTSLATGDSLAVHQPKDKMVRRLKVGFDEVLDPDGKRLQRPKVTETRVPLSQAMAEIGENAKPAHAPEGISAYMRGDFEGLNRYAQAELMPSIAYRLEVGEQFSKDPFDYTTRHHGLGAEVKGGDLTTQSFYRVVRPEDYIAEVVPSAAPIPAGTIDKGVSRVLDKNRADYFIIRQHPERSAALHTGQIFDYAGPEHEILFMKGNPTGNGAHVIESVACANDTEIMLELGKRGVTASSNLLKIGEEEYTELFHQRNLKQHIEDFKLRQQTARDTFQTSPLKHERMGSEPVLAEAIHIDASGKLVGDVEKLHVNGFYKLGEDHFVHIQREVMGDKIGFEVFTKAADAPGGLTSVSRTSAIGYDGEFEYKLTDAIRKHGKLTSTTEQEVMQVVEHFYDVSKGSSANIESAYAGNNLHQITGAERTVISPERVEKLQQAAEGKLECTFKLLHPDECYKPPKVEKPKAPEAKPIEPEGPIPPDATKVESGTADVTKGVEDAAAKAEGIGAKAEGQLGKFVRQNKTGLIIGGSVVALGAVLYGANRYINSQPKPEPEKPWAQRVNASSSGRAVAP